MAKELLASRNISAYSENLLTNENERAMGQQIEIQGKILAFIVKKLIRIFLRKYRKICFNLSVFEELGDIKWADQLN